MDPSILLLSTADLFIGLTTMQCKYADRYRTSNKSPRFQSEILKLKSRRWDKNDQKVLFDLLSL